MSVVMGTDPRDRQHDLGAQQDLRALYVDINATYLNPTRSLIPVALGAIADLSFFGPGHVDSAVLRRGLLAYIDETGPYDVVLTNSHIFFADTLDVPPGPDLFRRSYAFSFPPDDVLQLPAIARDYSRLKLPRIGILLESDYYNWGPKEIACLDQRADVLVGFGEQFFGLKKEMPGLSGEGFASKANDDWARYAIERAASVANLFHFVADTEFSFRRLKDRQADWSIVGIEYQARMNARETLVKAGLIPIPETRLRRGLSLAQRFGFMRTQRAGMITLLNYDFRRRLSSTRYSYTCGSGLDMPIRKFVEIPAAGAVLVCRPFRGFRQVGYVHGENCVVCEPQDVVDAHRWLEADPDRAQRIADAGRSLVLKQHSTMARAAQFRSIVEAVVSGTFAGGRWQEGRFQVLSNGALA